MVLAAALLVVAGFAGGAFAARRNSTTTAAGGGAAAAAAAGGGFAGYRGAGRQEAAAGQAGAGRCRCGCGCAAGAGGFGGAGGGRRDRHGGRGAPAVVGTVASVGTDRITVKNFAGAQVVVRVPAGTPVTSAGLGGSARARPCSCRAPARRTAA